MARNIPRADWQLPPGVDRHLWDYLHDADLAHGYDAAVADSLLVRADLAFAERHFERPGRLIDLGCGSGRLLVPLAQRGHAVLGVDLSEAMLAVAREKARAAGVAVQLLKANLVELDSLATESFDYAACLFSTLGMVMGDGNRRRVLEHVHRLLRPGGRFILHVHNYWYNLLDPQGRRWLAGNLWRRLERGDKHMPPHQGLAGLTLHLFTRREVIRLVTSVGFHIRQVQPLGLTPDGHLPLPHCGAWFRAHGYLLAAERPA